MKLFLKCVLMITNLAFGSSISAQEESIDLDSYDTDLDFFDEADSLMNAGADLRELAITFTIPDTANFEAVQVEVNDLEDGNKIRYRKIWTHEELDEEGAITEEDVDLNLGRY